ncbi:pre-mRNA splicing factor [Cymbomonas tetramitiformis]|uniref:Pre-mRNA splicing factor n=1 Tax=Cymbomonas tetramitiformis TaxID=36881 RepID=A0AAE0GVZ4_9CHLO|nr:pre-mRNA splicing factor [Cymbomonas tetramitiformis]
MSEEQVEVTTPATTEEAPTQDASMSEAVATAHAETTPAQPPPPPTESEPEAACTMDTSEAPPGEEPKPPPCPTESLWEVVNKDPSDFTSWTDLIKKAEETREIAKIQRVYDSFLGEFPLCYGYWKKYADQEKSAGNPEAIVSVYERGVAAIPYSVDLWVHYCNYLIESSNEPEAIRSLYERGLAYVGTDFLASPLWNKYLEYEASAGTPAHMAQIYSRVLQIPLQKLDSYWEGLNKYTQSKPVRTMMTKEEVAAADAQDKVRIEKATEAATAEKERKKKEKEEAKAKAAAEAAAAMEEGEVPEPAEEEPEEEDEPIQIPPEDEDALKAQYLSMREPLYKASKEEAQKRIEFESAIKRPYFHVKKLKEEELKNWSRYLDYAEKEWPGHSVVHLYERCVIACANYPEYWIRYAKYSEKTAGADAARAVIQRASMVFVKRRPEIHMFEAEFEERLGNPEAAKRSYSVVNSSVAPGLLQCIVRHANLERRCGDVTAARGVYERAIAEERAKESSSVLVHLLMQYARFLDEIAEDIESARHMYQEALKAKPDSRSLWEGAILIETRQATDQRVDHALALYERATAPPPVEEAAKEEELVSGLSATAREELSASAVVFADLHGNKDQLAAAREMHRSRFETANSTPLSTYSKKRTASDALGESSSKQAKVAATGTPGAPPQPPPPPTDPGAAAYAQPAAGAYAYPGYGAGYAAYGQHYPQYAGDPATDAAWAAYYAQQQYPGYPPHPAQ